MFLILPGLRLRKRNHICNKFCAEMWDHRDHHPWKRSNHACTWYILINFKGVTKKHSLDSSAYTQCCSRMLKHVEPVQVLSTPTNVFVRDETNLETLDLSQLVNGRGFRDWDETSTEARIFDPYEGHRQGRILKRSPNFGSLRGFSSGTKSSSWTRLEK